MQQTSDEARRAFTTRPPVPPSSPINIYKIGAVLAQVGSCLTTYAFFQAIMVGSDLPIVIAVSICVEFILFLGKKMLFSKRHNSKQIAVPSIMLDTLLNAGGLWPYAKNIAASPTAIMLSEALALRDTIGAIPALILSLVAGYLLAVAPHTLWKAGE